MTRRFLPRLSLFAVLTVLSLLSQGRLAFALPAGRAWATWENLAHPRLVQSGTPRLEVDSTGVPFMIIASRWDTSAAGPEWTVFRWQETGWAPHLLTGIPADNFPDPVISLTSEHYLLWLSLFPSGPFTGLWPMMFVPIHPRLGVPETTMVTLDQSSEYGGAVSSKRRWVVRSQQVYPFPIPHDSRLKIRTVYSDTESVWHELPQLANDAFMCTIAPLADYSAMVVYSDEPGLRWARVDGDQWSEQGVIDPRGGSIRASRRRPLESCG